MNAKNHLVTILISIHLLAIILKALPAPEGAMSKSDWAHPTVQKELTSWSANLQTIGLDLSTNELESHLWSLAQQTMKIRRVVLKPFRKYYRYCGADQNWRLFVAPHMVPSRLEIDILENNEWKPIYRRFRDPNWMAQLIENGRFRPSVFRYSWGRYKGTYNKFAQFLTARASEEFSNATQIRFRWWRYSLPTPEQVLNQEPILGKYHTALIYHLDEQ